MFGFGRGGDEKPVPRKRHTEGPVKDVDGKEMLYSPLTPAGDRVLESPGTPPLGKQIDEILKKGPQKPPSSEPDQK